MSSRCAVEQLQGMLQIGSNHKGKKSNTTLELLIETKNSRTQMCFFHTLKTIRSCNVLRDLLCDY